MVHQGFQHSASNISDNDESAGKVSKSMFSFGNRVNGNKKSNELADPDFDINAANSIPSFELEDESLEKDNQMMS